MFMIMSIGSYIVSKISGANCLVPAQRKGVYCSCIRQVPMVTCILFHYTKIMTNSSLAAERSHCRPMLLWDTFRKFEV